MSEGKEQHTKIKYHAKLEKTGTKTYVMIKTAFLKEAISCIQTLEWLLCFKDWQCPLKMTSILHIFHTVEMIKQQQKYDLLISERRLSGK
jgi:hypothetical protein